MAVAETWSSLHARFAREALEGNPTLDERIRVETDDGTPWLPSIIRALSMYDGQETYRHSWRVARGVVLIGRHCRWPEETAGIGIRAALLHDVGKIFVPRSIVMYPGALATREWAELRRHPRLGHEVVRIADAAAATVLVAHHECAWRSSEERDRNYPRTGERRRDSDRRLIRRALAVERRLHDRRQDLSGWRPLQVALAVSDVVDALASERWYKEPWTDGAIRTVLAEHFSLVPDVAEWLIARRAELQQPVPPPPFPMAASNPLPPRYA